MSDTVSVVIAYSPTNPSEQGKTRKVSREDATWMIAEGRARWPEGSHESDDVTPPAGPIITEGPAGTKTDATSS